MLSRALDSTLVILTYRRNQPSLHSSRSVNWYQDGNDKALTISSAGCRNSLYRPNAHSSCLYDIPLEVECISHPRTGWLTPFLSFVDLFQCTYDSCRLVITEWLSLRIQDNGRWLFRRPEHKNNLQTSLSVIEGCGCHQETIEPAVLHFNGQKIKRSLYNILEIVQDGRRATWKVDKECCLKVMPQHNFFVVEKVGIFIFHSKWSF